MNTDSHGLPRYNGPLAGGRNDPRLLLVDEGYVAHWREGQTDDEYHADYTALSSTMHRKAVKSAKSFEHYFIKGKKEEPTDAMKFGTLFHHAALQGPDFMQRYVAMPEFGDLKQKVNRDKRANWIMDQKPGTVITTQEEVEKITGMLESMMSHDEARNALSDGIAEVPGYFRDPETGILCRIKPDFVGLRDGALIDIKTTKSCEEYDFERDIRKHGYHIQMAFYAHGIEQITGVKIDNILLIAVEKEPPYECTVNFLTDPYKAIGRYELRRGLKVIREGIKSGQWPKRHGGVNFVVPPAYVLQEYELKGVNFDVA